MRKIRTHKKTQRKPVSIDKALSNVSAFFSSSQILSQDVRPFFEAQGNANFNNISIHKGENAQLAAEHFNAKAFAFNNHIFFNKNEYQPHTAEGEKLLAHELAHVQFHRDKNTVFRQLKGKPVTVATPEPKKAIAIQGGGFSISLGHVTISVLPDVYNSAKTPDNGALTFFEVFPVLNIPSPDPLTDPATNKVTSFTAPPAFSIGLRVQTHYGNLVKPEGPSDYGYGTRPQDTKAKQNTIRFHEGSHGTEFISYVSKEIKKYPLPVFEGKAGMTLQEFNLKDKEYVDKISAIYNMFKSAAQYAKELVDCAGISIDKHNKGRAGYVNVCP